MERNVSSPLADRRDGVKAGAVVPGAASGLERAVLVAIGPAGLVGAVRAYGVGLSALPVRVRPGLAVDPRVGTGALRPVGAAVARTNPVRRIEQLVSEGVLGLVGQGDEVTRNGLAGVARSRGLT